MNITKFAVEKYKITTVVLLSVIFGGIYAFFQMPQDEDPGFTVRTALIATYLPGASPKRMEELVTDKLEKRIQEIPELDYVKSISRNGTSIIFVNIKESYKNMRPIWDDLRRKVQAAKNDLPNGVYGPYVNDDFGDVYGIIVSITGDGFSYREMEKIGKEVKDEFLRIPDVAKVHLYGLQKERIFIDFNPSKIARLGLTTYQLGRLLQAQNIIIPGGSVEVGQERISLEPTGNFQTVEQIKNIIINVPKISGVIYLGDIAKIYRAYVDPPKDFVRTNGKKSIAIGISMRKGGNVIKLGKNFMKTYNRLKNAYPAGIKFHIVAYKPARVRHTVMNFMNNLLQSIAIVVLVMLLALGLRTGLLVSTLIPITIIMTFLIMHFFNIGIDQVSLGALLIALGMLVDNAVVVSESIMVLMSEGKKPLDAALMSVKELKKPLLISSLTTSSAFLPIFLAKSMVGEYTASIFKVLTISLLSSWVLAMTLIPLLCVYFVKVKKKKEGEKAEDKKIYAIYHSILNHLLRHRAAFLIVMIGLLGLSIYGLKYVPKIFFPASDNKMMKIELNLPYGTTVKRTSEVVAKIENHLIKKWKVSKNKKDGVENFISFIGRGAPRYILVSMPEPGRENYAYILVNVSTYKIIPEISKELTSFIKKELPEANADIGGIILGPPVSHPVEVRIMGKNEEKLFKIVTTVKEKLRTIKGTKEINDDWGAKTKKIVVKINQARARRVGLTSKDIAVSLQTALSGITVTKFRKKDKLIPIVLRADKQQRNNLEKLKTINVYSQLKGFSVPLAQVADLKTVWEPSRILRRNRYKTVTVYSLLKKGYTANQINQQIIPWLKKEEKKWGPGFHFEIGGTDEKSDESNKSIMAGLPIAGIIILLLLVFQFNSYRKPLLLISVVPLGIIGVVGGLLLNNSFFGFMTLLGVVSLSGIVINNANVLMDRIQIELDNGKEPQKAIIDACLRRLRPIFLTTGTTVGGLIPLWIGGGPLWQPLAIALLFGLAFATVITLGMVPVLYSLFFGIKYD